MSKGKFRDRRQQPKLKEEREEMMFCFVFPLGSQHLEVYEISLSPEGDTDHEDHGKD